MILRIEWWEEESELVSDGKFDRISFMAVVSCSLLAPGQSDIYFRPPKDQVLGYKM